MTPLFFATPAAFRSWLEQHHATAPELLVGFHKKGSGEPSITWPESVDEALCFGWIDGVRRGLDETRYTIRFTPRRARSTWSAVNIRRVEELTREGRMRPAGLAAAQARTEERSNLYAYEQAQPARLETEHQRRFEREADAWSFFQAQAPSYQRSALHWVTSARQEATRERRLVQLITDSREGRRLAQFIPTPRPKK